MLHSFADYFIMDLKYCDRRTTNLSGLHWLGFPTVILVLAELIACCCSWRIDWQPNAEVVIQGMGNGIQWFIGNETAPDHFKILFTDQNSMLLGARNYIYNISMVTLKENMHLEWQAGALPMKICTYKQTSENLCQNYIRVLAKKNPNELLVCGTNAFEPLCRTYVIEGNTYRKINEESGRAICPFDPYQNSTSVFTDGLLFTATVADFSARDPLIFSRMIRTEQYDSKWLNEPQFVSSFSYGNKVYFLFREAAIEHINCGKAIFSRVARVCKIDQGGENPLVDTWTSFFKARLNCSIPGEFPFYFDEIQSSTEVGQGNYMSTFNSGNRSNMVYGVFNTPENSITASAVCAFKMADIAQTFRGRFKGQKSSLHNWLAVQEKDTPTPSPEVCNTNSKRLPYQTLDFIKSHPLMDNAVPPAGGRPLLIHTRSSYKFVQIVVDWQVHASNGRYYDIMFVGTDNGHVIKAINKGRGAMIEPVVIEDILVFPRKQAIVSLKIYRNKGLEKLIIVSKDDIVSIPLHRCNEKHTCRECMALQDPYCSWVDNKCAASDRGVQSIHTGIHHFCDEVDTVAPTNSTTTTMTSASTCPPCAPCTPCPSGNLLELFTTTTTRLSGGVGKEIPRRRKTTAGPNSTTEKSWSIHVGENEVPASHSLQVAERTFNTAILATSVVSAFVIAAILGFLVGYKVSSCKYTQTVDSPTDDTKADLRGHQDRDHYYSKTENLGANKRPLNYVWNVPPKSGKLPNGSAETRAIPYKGKKEYL